LSLLTGYRLSPLNYVKGMTMKLYLNETSPFSRVVLATAMLTNIKRLNQRPTDEGAKALTGTLDLIWVDPWQSPDNLKAVNPFCTIPVLELDNGTALSESACICEYLIAAAQAKTEFHKQLNTESYKPVNTESTISSQANEDISEQLVGVNYLDAASVAIMGFGKTMMETAFRTLALGRFIDSTNPLSDRGNAGLAASLNRLDNDLSSTQQAGYIQADLANLYLYVAIEYVQFRHSEIFNKAVTAQIAAFLEQSPFKGILNRVSLAVLSSKPDFSAL
jgi:glutathione S-transferase